MTSEQFKRAILPNGVRLVTESVDFVHSVALGIWVLAGSQDETAETNGLAHLLEHMAFKGTKTRDAFQIANTIESLGGVINAFTSRDLTCYYLRIIDEHLETGIDILSDLILNPIFDREELDKEKSVIIEEIKDIEDTPSDIISDYFTNLLYPNHPLGRPVQGTIDNVKNFTGDQLQQFINDNYSADRIVIAASGKVDYSRIDNLAREYFGRLKAGDGRRDLPDIPPIKERGRVYPKPVNQHHLMVGRRIFPQSDLRRYQIGILNIILSGGMSSRLFHNIRNRYGFVYSIHSFYEFFASEGMFGIYAAVNSDRIDRVKKMIYDEIDKIANNNISDEELNKAKQQFKGGLVLSLENMHWRMNRLAKMEIYDKELLTVDDLLKVIEGISKEDIVKLAKYLMDQDSFVEIIIQPKVD